MTFKLWTFKRMISRRKFFIGVAVLVLILLFIAKSFLFKSSTWRDNDIGHIVKILVQWQSFPLNSIPIVPLNSSISLPEQLRSDLNTHVIGQYTNFYMYRIENDKADITGFDSSKQLETFLNFQPMMSSVEKRLLLYTFQVFIQVCEKFDLTYFVVEGTLLGVHRHMGLIPWDDDVDVIMNASEWDKIRNAFSGIKEIGLNTNVMYQWKIFPKLAFSMDKDVSFKWPFVDICFFAQDETHLWGLTPFLKPNFLFNKKDVYPLRSRPFENFQVNVPSNSEKILPLIYNVSHCQSASYIHKRNLDVPVHMVKSVPCMFLFNLYPFVFRHFDSQSGRTIEQLKLGSLLLKEIKYS